MSDFHIKLRRVLTNEEYQAVDQFALSHRGVEALPAWAGFLKAQFNVALEIDPDIVVGFATDSSNLPGKAQAVCRPGSARECALVFRACFKAGIPFLVSGGRSNLTGSATPDGGVVISAVRLLTLDKGDTVRIDASARTAECAPGVILEDIRRLVLTQSGDRLMYPVDPTSRADASVGGTLACNASGFVPGSSGATRDWVESIDVLLPNGLAIEARRGQYVSQAGRFILEDGPAAFEWPVPGYARPSIKNAGGPFSAPDGAMDLIDLIIGSEGIFGMVLGCRLKLADKPAGFLDLFFSLPSEDDALAFREHVSQHVKGDLSGLGALEYFGVNSAQHMDHRELLFKEGHSVGIYLQMSLRDQSLEDVAEEWMTVILESGCHVQEEAIMLLDDERSWKIFMEARHSLPANALEVTQHRGTFTIMTDTVVPPERFREFLAFAHATISAQKLDYVAFGHFGDCHLHFTMMPHPEQLESAVAVYDALVAKSAELGGVYSGEHGTGKRKRKDFLKCYGPAAVDDVRRSKQAVDPEFLLNRGNVVLPV